MRITLGLMLAALCLSCTATPANAQLRVGFGEVDITPALSADRPVYLAGYGQNRKATAVHDPIMARAVVMHDGKQMIALVSVDLIGVMLPTVQEIRRQLDGFAYVLVAATHNHEAPDTIGLWGPSPIKTGVDPAYTKQLIAGCIKAIELAREQLKSVTATYSTADDESLLGDSRLPKVYDGTLRVLRFQRSEDGKSHGLLVQWNCHPEAMGSKNTQITADFPWATIAALKKKHDCPVVYVSGAVGGLMAPPDGVVKDAQGRELKEGDFEYTRVYGEMVAALAEKAMASARPIELTPFTIRSRTIYLPLHNAIYMLARQAGVLQREAFIWEKDSSKRGAPYLDSDINRQAAVETELGYLRLGELHLTAIPGEIYPELISGHIQDPADDGADFRDAPKEKHLHAMLPDRKLLIIGLANDEIGYIIPKRQWDVFPPHAYGRKKSQYGEINSLGPDTAPLLMNDLEALISGRKPTDSP